MEFGTNYLFLCLVSRISVVCLASCSLYCTQRCCGLKLTAGCHLLQTSSIFGVTISVLNIHFFNRGFESQFVLGITLDILFSRHWLDLCFQPNRFILSFFWIPYLILPGTYSAFSPPLD